MSRDPTPKTGAKAPKKTKAAKAAPEKASAEATTPKKPAARASTRGPVKLRPLAPLLGTWVTETTSERGPLRCTRVFTPILAGRFLELRATWVFADSSYEERAHFGVGDDGALAFWSFTSDGKRSTGAWTDVSALHPEAIGFVAEMPAGRARQAWWPHPEGGLIYVVESENKQGWRRFLEHHCRPA